MRYSVNPVRIRFSGNFSWYGQPHMIVLSGFFLIIIFIYSIEILAGFSAFAGI